MQPKSPRSNPGNSQSAESSLFTEPAPLPVTQLDDEARLACLRLARSYGVGPTTFRELINHYGGAKQALDALPHISRARTRGKPLSICSNEDAENELEAANKLGIKPVFTIEPGYPHRLANLAVPPPLLYILGNHDLLQKPAIAIVGARLASAAGTKLARLFAFKLATADLVIVSGLARGIDKAAHEAALDASTGAGAGAGTIAVVAGGVDVIYPPENEALHALIAKGGAIVSEMPCGFKPRAKDFPRRNRIISGLSLGVLVIEAAKRSGSLVTARQAGEQGREVFAIPGNPLDPRAQGTNALLKNGATLVTEPEDIVLALKPMAGADRQGFREPQMQSPAARPSPDAATAPDEQDEISEVAIPENENGGSPKPKPIGLPTPARTPALENHADLVRQTLSAAPVDLDAILRATELGAHHVRAALLELELNGEIEHHGANLISLKPPNS